MKRKAVKRTPSILKNDILSTGQQILLLWMSQFGQLATRTSFMRARDSEVDSDVDGRRKPQFRDTARLGNYSFQVNLVSPHLKRLCAYLNDAAKHQIDINMKLEAIN